MTVMATERIRLVLLVPEEIRQALKLEAAKQGTEMSELAEQILREAMPDSVEEIRQRNAKRKRKSDQP